MWLATTTGPIGARRVPFLFGREEREGNKVMSTRNPIQHLLHEINRLRLDGADNDRLHRLRRILAVALSRRERVA